MYLYYMHQIKNWNLFFDNRDGCVCKNNKVDGKAIGCLPNANKCDPTLGCICTHNDDDALCDLLSEKPFCRWVYFLHRKKFEFEHICLKKFGQFYDFMSSWSFIGILRTSIASASSILLEITLLLIFSRRQLLRIYRIRIE